MDAISYFDIKKIGKILQRTSYSYHQGRGNSDVYLLFLYLALLIMPIWMVVSRCRSTVPYWKVHLYVKKGKIIILVMKVRYDTYICKWVSMYFMLVLCMYDKIMLPQLFF